jgi:hypothetical protein
MKTILAFYISRVKFYSNQNKLRKVKRQSQLLLFYFKNNYVNKIRRVDSPTSRVE